MRRHTAGQGRAERRGVDPPTRRSARARKKPRIQIARFDPRPRVERCRRAPHGADAHLVGAAEQQHVAAQRFCRAPSAQLRSFSMTTTEAMPAMIKGTIFRLLQQAALVHRAMANHKREQVQLSQKNLEIADVGVRETLTATSRSVRNAYWELAYQIAALQVARQSLELAEESLRNTRSRIEIGTTPPIDAVEADAEVATRREAVIVAEAQIETAQDTLRALVYNPSMPDFWTIRIEPADMPSLDR